MEPEKSAGVWPTVKPFVNGGASGMLATCVIQPIDMVKVRIQLGQGSAVTVTRNMLRDEGFRALYKGLSAGLLRQATYTTARLGSFKVLSNKAMAANDGKPLPLYQKALCGLSAGAIGACIGSPADLALIRLQADATLPAAQRRNYKNAFHALYRIAADEGIISLWKGAGPTVVRAMALNMGMLASYDQSVEFFRDSLGLGEAATVFEKINIIGLYVVCYSNWDGYRIETLNGERAKKGGTQVHALLICPKNPQRILHLHVGVQLPGEHKEIMVLDMKFSHYLFF